MMGNFLFSIFKKEGGKKFIDSKKLIPIIGSILGILLLAYCTYIVFKSESNMNTGRIQKAPSPFIEETFKIDFQVKEKNERKRAKPPRAENIKRKYHARQVLSREKENIAPIQGNLLAELLTSIDTRSKQTVKAMLSLDGTVGESIFPIGTLFLGQVQDTGKGDRVFIQFNEGVYPDGRKFKINAHALSLEDYALGLRGISHGNAKGRSLATMGLSMLSEVSKVLIEREALGGGLHITPKPSLKNGLYGGASKVIENEAQKKATELYRGDSYLTVEIGRDIVIALTRGKG